MFRKQSDEAKRCSFCHKSQDVVGKLISSPSDYPRAYICDECVVVCNSILEDSRLETAPSGQPEVHPVHEMLDQLRPEELDAVRHLLEVMLQGRWRGYAKSSGPPPAKPAG